MSDGTAKDGSRNGIWKRIGGVFENRSRVIVISTIVITLLLLAPMVLLYPDEWASGNPEDEIFDLSDRIEERMPLANMYSGFIVESKDGDILTSDALSELLRNQEELRRSEIGRKYLVSRYDVELDRWNPGIYTIADAVNSFLLSELGTHLDNSTDDQVKFAISMILSSPDGSSFRDSFSEQATSNPDAFNGIPIESWESPAIILNIFSDTTAVEDDYSKNYDDSLLTEVVKEHYNREIQKILRGEQENYRLWGIAIDQQLESEEEAMFSFVLIFAALVMILILVTVLFRSPKVSMLTLIGLIMLLIWWRALSNIAGVKQSLTVDILIPVSVMVLGVDYVIHALHRYDEERGRNGSPRSALGRSVAGVGGALFLAMTTTVVAFGSNISSELEDIVGFGVSASLAIISAFWIMGFFIPSLKMLWDERLESKGRLKKIGEGNGKGSKILGRMVTSTSRWRGIVLPVVLLISIGSGFLAVELEPKLDVKEFFDPSSDFVVSLDKLSAHLKESGGEQVNFYIEGDLEDPDVLRTIKDFEMELEDNENIARDPRTGELQIYAHIFDPLERLLANNYSMQAVSSGSGGVEITDIDNDSIPDTREQLEAVLNFIYFNGIPKNQTHYMYDMEQIRALLWLDPDEENNYATIVMTGIPDTREIDSVREAEKEFKEDIKVLDAEGIIDYGYTGPPVERERQLTAITDSLTISIAVAVVLCFLVLVVLFRSFKYALVTVIPEILVVFWLYAAMYLMGYHLNAVTATIAAISIGVGIDYSVHVTARFREELSKGTAKQEAMRNAASHSGVALFGSALSTMIGFFIIGFAPMPMFASFGILTAIMILMAFIAALFVLPSLLLLVTGDSA